MVLGWLILSGLLASNTALSGPTTPAEPNSNPPGSVLTPWAARQCIVQVSRFGHYQTQWRIWPKERRPDRFFPQSIGLEAIPTPEPGPMPELPRQKLSPEKPTLPPLPKLPTELPLTPPEEKSPGPSGAGQPSAPPLEKPFRIEERSPLESIQPTPLEPMRPGTEKPGVQMPLPLEPSSKPASQMPLPGEPMSKPATQLPLPLEPLPPEKPPGRGAVPGPGGELPPLPSVPEQSGSSSGLPPLPIPKEQPSSPVPPAESAPEKPSSGEKTSESVPLVPKTDLRASAAPLEPSSPSNSPLRSPNRGSSLTSSAPPLSSLAPLSEPMASESGAAPPTRSQTFWPNPAPESSSAGSSQLPSKGREPTTSRSGGLADPLEPWAEPKAWHPSNWSAHLHPQLPQEASARYGSDRHGSERIPTNPISPPSSTTPPPEAPPIEPGWASDKRHESGPTQAFFQTDLPVPDRGASGSAAGGSVPPPPTDNYQLEGYCPVCLLEKEQWVPGNTDFAVQYQGKVYLLAGPSQRERFLANPHRYVPVAGGIDPVVAVEENRHLPGRTDYCVVYDGRLYLFSSPETLARFHQNPKKYASFANSR
ncbi:MAG: YHS domain-containing protein [Thermoguttaceae bacterium]|nr:YHS domain-containing protein [Thermoguttaceae bacterium]MDW8038868.1 YHS domain-containing protein [Thermoguttaceae bacterium]